MSAIGTTISAALAAATLAFSMSPAASYPRPAETTHLSVGGFPSISGDGRLVAFLSNSPSVTGDVGGDFWVMVADRASGQVTPVEPVRDAAETQASPGTHAPRISADGRFVTFASVLEPATGMPTSGLYVALRELATGLTTRITPATENSSVPQPTLSADGSYVAFASSNPSLVSGDTNQSTDIFVHNRTTGKVSRVSVANNGAQSGNSSTYGVISGDGRSVAFVSYAANLVGGDTNGKADVFVRDLVRSTTERASVASGGGQTNDLSLHPAVSADGRFVAFWSLATNIVASGGFHAYVHDRETGRTERVSLSSDGSPHYNMCGTQTCGNGTGASSQPAISADGRFVAFQSDLGDLADGDTNNRQDVFVHDRAIGATHLVSIGPDGKQRAGSTSWAAISDDGRWVAFSDQDSGSILVRDRGPAVGVRRLDVSPTPGGVAVEGSASFSGEVVSSAHDPVGDAEPGAFEVGADLVRASIAFRPEEEDLYLRWRVAFVSRRVNPGILYGVSMTVGGVAYELRGMRAGAEGAEVQAAPPSVSVLLPFFAVYRCDPICSRVGVARGGLGGPDDELVVAVPLSMLALDPGKAVSALRAFTAVGEVASGSLRELDALFLPGIVLPPPEVSLGIAPLGTPPEDVVFDTPAALAAGSFSASVQLPPGQREVWARACLGAQCGTASRVALVP